MKVTFQILSRIWSIMLFLLWVVGGIGCLPSPSDKRISNLVTLDVQAKRVTRLRFYVVISRVIASVCGGKRGSTPPLGIAKTILAAACAIGHD